MAGNLDKVFNTELYLRQQFTDVDIGKKTSDNDFQEYLFPLVNTQPISVKTIPPAKGSSVATVVLKRGPRWGKKQVLTFSVEQNFSAYFDAYSAFEVMFRKFIEQDIAYSKLLDENDDVTYLYVRRFNMQYLDTLPETMYFVHYTFTNNPNRWARFKRLFTMIAMNIDPVIISTIKFKFLEYLVSQRREVTMIDTPEAGMIMQEIPPELLHKAMDMFIFMPYCYLFPVYKAMDVNGDFFTHLSSAMVTIRN